MPSWVKCFEGERSFVGFAARLPSARFVDSEGSGDPIRAKHQTNVMQVNTALCDFLPDADADISSAATKKRIFELGVVGMPRFEGLEERRSIVRRVDELPKAYNGGEKAVLIVALVMIAMV
jgi:hypothetical protein